MKWAPKAEFSHDVSCYSRSRTQRLQEAGQSLDIGWVQKARKSDRFRYLPAKMTWVQGAALRFWILETWALKFPP